MCVHTQLQFTFTLYNEGKLSGRNNVVDLFNAKPFNDLVQPLPPHRYP